MQPSKIIKIFVAAAAILTVAACSDLFHQYRSVEGGWMPTDTLTFQYHSSAEGPRHCAVDIELRSGSSYPYKEIVLRVESASRILRRAVVDTLVCELYDASGHPHGSTSGILRQTSHPCGAIDILPGDTIEIKITHLMDDAPIDGILDVGVRLSQPGRHQF